MAGFEYPRCVGYVAVLRPGHIIISREADDDQYVGQGDVVKLHGTPECWQRNLVRHFRHGDQVTFKIDSDRRDSGSCKYIKPKSLVRQPVNPLSDWANSTPYWHGFGHITKVNGGVGRIKTTGLEPGEPGSVEFHKSVLFPAKMKLDQWDRADASGANSTSISDVTDKQVADVCLDGLDNCSVKFIAAEVQLEGDSKPEWKCLSVEPHRPHVGWQRVADKEEDCLFWPSGSHGRNLSGEDVAKDICGSCKVHVAGCYFTVGNRFIADRPQAAMDIWKDKRLGYFGAKK